MFSLKNKPSREEDMKSGIKLRILALLDLSAEWELRLIVEPRNTWLLKL